MHAVAETASQNQSLYSVEADTSLEKTYVMKGAYSEKALETYHLILAPSFRCNLRCRHCYLPDHDALTLPKERILHLMDEWSEIVVSERGPFGGIFHLKGGEPLILPYLNDVLDHLAEIKTLRFMMTTNGIAGNQQVVERLVCLNDALDGHVQITVSIDGSNDDVNAQLRGTGNFEKALAFVRMLRDADITVFLNNVLHKGNLHDVESFIELAINLDVQQVNFLSFIPKGYGEKMASLAPDPDEAFKRIDSVWKRGDQRRRDLLAGSLSDILHAESCDTCTSPECVGGYRGLLYVVPDGTAYSCPGLKCCGLEAGSINKSSLRDIHEALLRVVYPRIHTPQNTTQDKYACKGFRYLHLSTGSHIADIASLQTLLDATEQAGGMSYCFNRNW